MSGMQQMQETQSLSHLVYDGEIDLGRLFAKIWRRKWWIASLASSCAVLAIIYVFNAKRTYQAELYLMPPSPAGLVELNYETEVVENKSEVGRDLIQFSHSVTPEQAYSKVLNQFRSKQLLLAYFEEAGLYEVYRTSPGESKKDVFERFVAAMMLNLPRKGEVIFTSLSLEGPSAERVATDLNGFVAKVEAHVINQLVTDFVEARNRKLRTLQQQIAGKRQLAKQRREDRIKVLEEANEIAQAVGIKSLGVSAQSQASAQQINIMSLDALFMRGTEALSAEISVLKSRRSDDAFIEGLREVQESVETLGAIVVDPNKIKPVSIDFEAVIPEKPIKPKKAQIVAAAIVLGFILGVFIALVVPARKE